MRESIVREIAPVITAMQIGGWLTGECHAAAAGAARSRLAPSSALHNLCLKHGQVRNSVFDWKRESVVPSVGAV